MLSAECVFSTTTRHRFLDWSRGDIALVVGGPSATRSRGGDAMLRVAIPASSASPLLMAICDDGESIEVDPVGAPCVAAVADRAIDRRHLDVLENRARRRLRRGSLGSFVHSPAIRAPFLAYASRRSRQLPTPSSSLRPSAQSRVRSRLRSRRLRCFAHCKPCLRYWKAAPLDWGRQVRLETPVFTLTHTSR